MPSKGTYAFYEHARPRESAKLFETYEKTKLLEQRAKREDDKLKLAQDAVKAQKKKANQIEIKAVDEFNAFAGKTGATAQRLTSQSGQILIAAKRMVDAGHWTKDQYTQIELNLQAGVHAYNEVSQTRKAEYDALMALDKDDFRDGELEKAQQLARKSFMKTANVHFNNDGTLYYQVDDKKQSIGEFYSSTEMPSMISARHNILGDIRDGIKPPIINQLLEINPDTGLYYVKPIKGNTELAIKIMADANQSSFDSGGVARQSGYNYENQMIANDYPSLTDKELKELEQAIQKQTDDEVYSLYTNAAHKLALEKNDAIRKGQKDKTETYYPALTKTNNYTKNYLEEEASGKSAIVDTSKIKGTVAKEEVIGNIIEMREGNPVIVNGKFKLEPELAETKGMKGQVKQVIKLDNDFDANGSPYYYVEMVSGADQDLSAALDGMPAELLERMLKKYKDQPVMLRLTEQQMKVLQARIPNILDVFNESGSQDEDDPLSVLN